MNALVSPVPDQQGNWIAPGGLSDDQFKQLASLNLDAVAQDDVDAINHYGDLWLLGQAHNQGIRMNGQTLKAEIGQDHYPDAKAAWFAIR